MRLEYNCLLFFNKMIGIYKITSPSGKIYIGQSINIHKRIIRYKNLLCEQQTYLFNSLKKYGWDKHEFEVIVECIQEELNDLEIFYINFYNSFNSKNGLNLREGGYNGKMSDATKLKIGLLKKGNKYALGKKHSEEAKKRCGDARKGKKRSIETKKRMSEAQKGKIVSQETKNKLSLAWKNRKVSEETKLKMSIGQKLRHEKLKNINNI